MDTVNMHDAKTHLSRLVGRAASGETIVIARAGVPLARLVPLVEGEPPHARRIGFLAGRATIPDDFDTLGGDDLVASFEGGQ